MLYSKPSIPKNTFVEINKIIDSGWVSIGKYVNELEEKVKDRYNVKHVIATSCATTGLIIALKAAGIKNKKIGVPAFTWPSTIYALECNNNIPVFLDIDKDSWVVDSGDDTYYDNIMPVDIFGADSGIYKNSVFDAAHGWDINGLGHRGLVEVISLSFTKVVTGQEGGLILTNDNNIADICKELRRLSGRMLEINALIALKSIEFWDKEAEYKREELRNEYISNLDFEFKTQVSNQNNSVFAILLQTSALRNKILRELSLENIETKIYYEPMIEGLSVTDEIYSKLIALPLHPFMNNNDVHKICNISNNAVKSCPGIKYLTNYFRKS